jgi:ABC-type glycerol-3-phosphate transport system substrate-binding protein
VLIAFIVRVDCWTGRRFLTEEKKISRRKYLKYAGAGVLAVAAAGAAGYYASQPTRPPTQTTATETTATEATATTPSEVVATYWTGFTGSDGLTMGNMPSEHKGIIGIFNERNKGKIRIESTNFDWAVLRDKFAAATAAKETDPDIYIDDYDLRMPMYMDEGVLYPLDEWIKRDIPKEVVNDFWDTSTGGLHWAASREGRLYGLPCVYYTYCFIVNHDLFRKHGLDPVDDFPKTWEELRELALMMTKDTNGDGVVDQFGLTIDSYECDHWAVLMWQMGGDFFDDPVNPSKATFDGAPGVKAAQFWHDAYNPPNPWTDPFAPGSDPYSLYFLPGNSAIHWGGGWCYPSLQSDAKFEFTTRETVPMKGTKLVTCGFIATYDIPINSDHKEEAWEFIKFWNTPEIQRIWSMGDKTRGIPSCGMGPTLLSIAQEPGFSESEYYKKFLGSFMSGFKYAKDYPKFPLFPELWQRNILPALQSIYSSPKVDVEETLKAAAEMCDKTLAQEGYPH